MFTQTLKHARRVIIAVVGFTILTLGIVMLVTPGPGWAVILLGLSILAAEFVWAKRLLKRFKKAGSDVASSIFGWRKKPRTPEKEETAASKDARPDDEGHHKERDNEQVETMRSENR